jgi:hypothetical protein
MEIFPVVGGGVPVIIPIKDYQGWGWLQFTHGKYL